jgi:PKD repeat protein
MKQTIQLIAFVLFLVGCTKDVPPAPVARFEFREESADRNGAIVKFSNLSTDATRFNWIFADGGSSSEHSPRHTFTKNGTYYVTLTADGDGGNDKFSQTVNIASIPTTGTFIFWSRIADKGNTTVTVAGNEVGKITVYQTGATVPACGTEGFVTVRLPEGTYSFTAKSQGLVPLNWSGTFQIVNGTCRSTELTR